MSVHRHHRKRRSQGGDDSPANLIELTPLQHEAVHRNPKLAYEHGLLVHSYDDPEDIEPDLQGFLAALMRVPVGNQGQDGEEPMQSTVDGGEIPHRHVVDANGVEKECPRCHGKGKVVEKQKDDLEHAPERKKTTWSVRVPKDERENGYEILESLMEAAVERMHEIGLIRDKNKSANYYTLVAMIRKFVVGETE